VKSLSHPGGNATGFSPKGVELGQKGLSLLKEAAPLRAVGVMVGSRDRFKVEYPGEAGRRLGLALVQFELTRPDDIDQAFQAFSKAGVNGVMDFAGTPSTYEVGDRLAALALEHRLRMLVQSGQADAGGLRRTLPTCSDAPLSWWIGYCVADRVRQAARLRKKEMFTALMHLVDVKLLRQSYFRLQTNAAAGVDGVTWDQYGKELEQRLVDLHGRIHRNAYRATPSRRQYIPKSDGRLRPLGIAALQDKIVQRAVVEVLNVVFETDFLGFSYGFRPKRTQHQALDALAVGIARTNVSWIVDEMRSRSMIGPP